MNRAENYLRIYRRADELPILFMIYKKLDTIKLVECFSIELLNTILYIGKINDKLEIVNRRNLETDKLEIERDEECIFGKLIDISTKGSQLDTNIKYFMEHFKKVEIVTLK